MPGLSINGFEQETLEAITDRIEGKLEAINPGFDFSPESPDGQLIKIMAFEIWQAWAQLDQVYNSYNPDVATGAALRNIGKITGLQYGSANRSYATIELQGTTGTVIPVNSIVTDDDGNEFYTAFQTTIPSNAQVICNVPGPVPVPADSITTIKTPVSGWTGVTQTTDGVIGTNAQSSEQYRNLRTKTVMRNYTSSVDAMQARLLELGVNQATVINNDSNVALGSIPANTIHVTVGDVGIVDDASIASVILETNAAGCPTYGTTTVSVDDSQGYPHDVSFTKATAVSIEIAIIVEYLTIESAGAEDFIKAALVDHINGLLAGEDVIWSRLFQFITPYGKARVNSLLINKTGDTPAVTDLVLTETEFAQITLADITITEA